MPPTENYQWRTCVTHHYHAKDDVLRSVPMKAFSLASAWEFIMDCINYEWGEGTIRMKESIPENSGYPQPWQSMYLKDSETILYLPKHTRCVKPTYLWMKQKNF